MFKLVEKRGLWFTISLIVTLPAILFMIYFGVTTGQVLPLSIDYTGGTVWEIRFATPVETAPVRDVFAAAGYNDTSVFTVGADGTVQIKLKPIDGTQKEVFKQTLTDQFGPFEELSYRSLGPSVGGEVSQAALVAVLVASGLILLYIAWAFRQVSHPFRYGITAVIALIHDVLVTLTFICIMYFLVGWEVDTLTLTAILTVLGFSMSDTVVVFDRIRENLRRYKGESFATIANRSLLETMSRSIATQITAFLVLVAILVLGGATLRQFVASLIVGFASGVFSSLFNATPLLVAWEEGSLLPRKSNNAGAGSGRVVSA